MDKTLREMPLLGKRILITRALSQADELRTKLEMSGAEVVEFPTIKIVLPKDFSDLDLAISKLKKNEYDWVIFTSVNGVLYFVNRVKKIKEDLKILRNATIAAIGPKTADELRKLGIGVDYIPLKYRAEEVAQGLIEQGIEGKRILLPRAQEAREALPKLLKKARALVDVITTYVTLPENSFVERTIGELKEKKVDIIIFTSSSTARNFFKLLKNKLDLKGILDKTSIACIGPVTSKTVKELGLSADIVAEKYTIDGLVEAILKSVEVI